MKPILSFCIPTYNRAEIVFRCVNSILTYVGDDIEVVVCDNNSQDNTEEILSSIKDTRFRYYKEYNGYGFTNAATVLFRAVGNYAVVISDEELCIAENLPQILSLLRDYPNYSVVMPTLNMPVATNLPFISAGSVPIGIYEYEDRVYPYLNSMLYLGFYRSYISGVIINVQLLTECTTLSQIIEKGGKFPHEYWINRLLIHGNMAKSVRTPLFIINCYIYKDIYIDKESFNNKDGDFAFIDHKSQLHIEFDIISNALKDGMNKKDNRDEVYCIICMFFIRSIAFTVSWVKARQGDVKHFQCNNDFQYYNDFLHSIYSLFIQNEEIFSIDNYKILISDLYSIFKNYYTPDFDSCLESFFKKHNSRMLKDCFLEALAKFGFEFGEFIWDLGKELKRVGDYERAIHTFENGIEYYSFRGKFNSMYSTWHQKTWLVSCYFHLGEIYYSTGDKLKAKEYFSKCLLLTDSNHSVASVYINTMG